MIKQERKIRNLEPPKPKFNLGDLIIINDLKKGIIFSNRAVRSSFGTHWEYEIYWIFNDNHVEIKSYSEGTIIKWISMIENKNNKNEYYPVVKNDN